MFTVHSIINAESLYKEAKEATLNISLICKSKKHFSASTSYVLIVNCIPFGKNDALSLPTAIWKLRFHPLAFRIFPPWRCGQLCDRRECKFAAVCVGMSYIFFSLLVKSEERWKIQFLAWINFFDISGLSLFSPPVATFLMHKFDLYVSVNNWQMLSEFHFVFTHTGSFGART